MSTPLGINVSASRPATERVGQRAREKEPLMIHLNASGYVDRLVRLQPHKWLPSSGRPEAEVTR